MVFFLIQILDGRVISIVKLWITDLGKRTVKDHQTVIDFFFLNFLLSQFRACDVAQISSYDQTRIFMHNL